jgi:predicted enzyme related to lactoylglutathione lyase
MANPGQTTLQRLVVSVGDLPRAVHFYRDVLGLTVRHQAPPLAFLVTGDGVEILLHERPTTPSRTAVALGFRLHDLDTVIPRVLAAGGAVVDLPQDQPWGERMSVVADPDGHLVCLSEVQDRGGDGSPPLRAAGRASEDSRAPGLDLERA